VSCHVLPDLHCFSTACGAGLYAPRRTMYFRKKQRCSRAGGFICREPAHRRPGAPASDRDVGPARGSPGERAVAAAAALGGALLRRACSCWRQRARTPRRRCVRRIGRGWCSSGYGARPAACQAVIPKLPTHGAPFHLINAEKRQRSQRRYQNRILCQDDTTTPCTTFGRGQFRGVE